MKGCRAYVQWRTNRIVSDDGKEEVISRNRKNIFIS